jgi:deoxyribonuclease-1-like protein
MNLSIFFRKTEFFILIIFTVPLYSQTKILSWNLENLGSSKSENTIEYIAKTLKDYDIIAIQEVVVGIGGAQAVAELAAELNRKEFKWDYTISNPTSSSAYKTERYAFIWKTAKIKKIGDAWLEKKYNLLIDREPFFCTFQYQGQEFTVANFHAITKNKQPETEIKYFKLIPQEYPNLNIIFAGDFNCPQSHSVFIPLKKMGYLPVLVNQKTSLKQKCKNGNCLASEFDNFFYDSSKLNIMRSDVIHFYKDFKNLKEAKKISDHIPIWCEFSLN